MISHITNYKIIKFYAIRITFFLDMSFRNYDLVEKKPSEPSRKMRKKSCILIGEKYLKLNEKIKKKTKRLD